MSHRKIPITFIFIFICGICDVEFTTINFIHYFLPQLEVLSYLCSNQFLWIMNANYQIVFSHLFPFPILLVCQYCSKHLNCNIDSSVCVLMVTASAHVDANQFYRQSPFGDYIYVPFSLLPTAMRANSECVFVCPIGLGLSLEHKNRLLNRLVWYGHNGLMLYACEFSTHARTSRTCQNNWANFVLLMDPRNW